MDEFLLELQAKLDEAKSKGLINADIEKIQQQINKLKLQAEVDPKSISNIAKQLESVVGEKITIGLTANIDNNAMNRIKKASDSSTNAIIQNEKKKQEAIHETANAYKSLSENESIVKSGAGVTNFAGTNNAAKEAQRYFQELLKDEQAVIATTEKFGENNNLTSFSVDIKRASGEVETLKYKLDALKDDEGNISDVFYKLSESSINDAGAIKHVQQIENAFADFTQKLAQFKSTNSEILSGLTTPLSDFENKLAGLKNGTTTINEVTNAYKSLNTEASNITANFSRQLSPIDSAIRSLAKGEETISGLRAEFKGLNNAPKEINTELNKCASLLANVKKIESEQGRTADWSKAYKEWANSVDTLKAKLTTLRKEQTNVASTQIFNISDLKNNNIAYMSKVYNTIEKQMSEINKMANAKNWNIVDISGVEQADGKIKQLTLTVRDAEGALKKLTMQREKLQGNGKAQYGLMQVGDVKVIETASQVQEKLAQNTEKANAKLTEQANKIQLSLDTGEYESKVDNLIARTRQWTDENGNARISTSNLSQALADLNTAQKNLSQNNTVENQQALIDAEKNLSTQVKIVTSEIRGMNAEFMKSSAIDSLRQRVQQFYDINGKSHRNFGAELKRIMSELGSGMEVPIAKGKQLEQEFINIQNKARQTGQLGKTFFQTIKEGMSSFSYWTSSTFLVMKAINETRQAITTVKELDTALVDLKKTANMSTKELESFYYASNDVAKQMGVTTEEILNQAAAWSRLGFNTAEQATQMAKYSSMFAMISPGMNIDNATDGLVSMMKAFKIGAEDVSEVVDGIMSKVNIIGNTRALSNSDIVEILTRSSSAMAEANNTLEETIALGTAMVEITRNAENAGTVLKTVSMRIRGYDEETEEYIGGIEELSGKIADLTKTASTPGGISLFTDASKTEYKSTVQLLREISEIYDDLTDKDQAALLEVLAGKRNGQAIAAALNNFDAVEDALNSMANSAGNAEAEMAIVMDSIAYKANQLKETGTGIAQNLFQREDMKNVLDVLNTFMGMLDKVTEKLGLFGTLGAGAGLFAGIKNVGGCENAHSHCFELPTIICVL